MTQPTIFYTEPGNISDRQKKKLEEAGVLVILVQDVEKVKLVGEKATQDLTELFYMACTAVRSNFVSADSFGKSLAEKVYKDTGYYGRNKSKET